MRFEDTKYGQKLIQMVETVAHQHFDVVENVQVEKTDDAIYVSFVYSQNDNSVKYSFRGNLLENTKTKKLRDLKRALNDQLSTLK